MNQIYLVEVDDKGTIVSQPTLYVEKPQVQQINAGLVISGAVIVLASVVVGRYIAYWWDSRPMSKKQREACIKWESNPAHQILPPGVYHNHCWRKDGTCYGAFGDGPDGKCTAKEVPIS